MSLKSPDADAALIDVTFSLTFVGATTVHLAIFLNNWLAESPASRAAARARSHDESHMMVRYQVPLKQVQPGLWCCVQPLAQGWYEYLFIVDGVWVMDPDAPETCPDGAGGFNAARMVEPLGAPRKAIHPVVTGTGGSHRSTLRHIS